MLPDQQPCPSNYLTGRYEHAIENGKFGGYLHSNGIRPSQVNGWLRLRDVGIIDCTAEESAGSLRTETGDQSDCPSPYVVCRESNYADVCLMGLLSHRYQADLSD